MAVDVNVKERYRDRNFYTNLKEGAAGYSVKTISGTTDDIPEGTVLDRLYVDSVQRAVLQILDNFTWDESEPGTLLFTGNFAATGEIQAWSDDGTGLPGSLLDALPIATTTSLGIMQVGTGLSVVDGLVSVVGGGTSAIWGQITGTLSNQTDLQAALDGKLDDSDVSGIANYIAKFTGLNSVGNSIIYDNGTNVGIGTSSPISRTTIQTTSTSSSIPLIIGQPLSVNAYTGLGFQGYVAGGAAIKSAILHERTGTFGVGKLHFAIDGISDNSNVDSSDIKMTLSNNGNVGIGTTTPTEKLDVNGFAKIGLSGDLLLGFRGASIEANFGTNDNLVMGAKGTGHISYGFYDGTGGHIFYNGAQGEIVRFTSAGNVGIGTTSPSQKLHVVGNARVTGGYYDSNNSAGSANEILSSTVTGTDWKSTIELGIVLGSGTLNYLPKWTPNGTTLGNSLIYDNGTNVGIGTINPLSLFHITKSDDNMLRLTRTNVRTWRQGINSSGFFQLTDITAGNDRLTIDQNGNVGIGTTSPLKKLHVYNGASGGIPFASSDFVIENSSTAILQFLTPNTNVQGIMFGDPEDEISGYLRYSHNDNSMRFYVNGLEKVSILNNGKVGIGTTTPTEKLDVNGFAKIGLSGDLLLGFRGASIEANFGTNDNLVMGAKGTGHISYGFYDGTGGHIFYNGAQGEIVRFTSAGNVGIGTTSPDVRFNVQSPANANSMTLGSTTGIAQGITSSDGLEYGMYFGVSNIGKSWIQGGRTNTAIAYDISLQASGGNVGIGTTSPGTLLEIRKSGNFGSPDAIYSTTLDRASFAIGNTISETRLMFGLGSGDYLWLQSQNSDNSSKSIVINPIGGSVGIGTTNPTEKLDVNGNIIATGEITAFSTSDIRLKCSIQQIENINDIFNNLNPIRYRWNEKMFKLMPSKRDVEEFGFLAQEIERVLPDIVHPIHKIYKSIDYKQLIPLIIKMQKEQLKEIEYLKLKLKKLK